MAAHLAETIDDNIRQECELANNEVKIIDLNGSIENLQKLLTIAARNIERLSDKFQQSMAFFRRRAE